MEFLTIPQEKEINKISTIVADDNAKKKGYFPKRKFKAKDILKLIRNKNRIQHTMISLFKSADAIKAHDLNTTHKTEITKIEFEKLDSFIRDTLKIDSWGIAQFNELEIYKGNKIPYHNVIVLSKHMDNHTFVVNQLPNMDCMLEVMEVYGDTGVACLETTELLRNMGFAAIPNHSLGGNVDYTKAGLKANLGFIGKHGLLITPESGPCNRISIVYTSIENLNDFLKNDLDHSWGNEFCQKCGNCVRSCPYQAIYEQSIIDKFGHVECISNQKCNSGFAHYGCAICIAACPFTKISYQLIKEKQK